MGLAAGVKRYWSHESEGFKMCVEPNRKEAETRARRLRPVSNFWFDITILFIVLRHQ